MTTFRRSDPTRRKTFRVSRMADHYEVRLEINNILETQAQQSMRVMKIMQKMERNPQVGGPGIGQSCADLLVRIDEVSRIANDLRSRLFGDA